jgi:hypothetical protein
MDCERNLSGREEKIPDPQQHAVADGQGGSGTAGAIRAKRNETENERRLLFSHEGRGVGQDGHHSNQKNGGGK